MSLNRSFRKSSNLTALLIIHKISLKATAAAPNLFSPVKQNEIGLYYIRNCLTRFSLLLLLLCLRCFLYFPESLGGWGWGGGRCSSLRERPTPGSINRDIGRRESYTQSFGGLHGLKANLKEKLETNYFLIIITPNA